MRRSPSLPRVTLILLGLVGLIAGCADSPRPPAEPTATQRSPATAALSPTPVPANTATPSPTIETTGAAAPTPTLDPERPPSIQLRAGATLYDGLEGSYCWQGGRRGLCVDKIFPSFDSYQPWPAGQTVEIVINGPAPIELSLQVIKKVGEGALVNLALTPGQTATWTPSVPPGNYAVAVFARWPEGDVVYSFPLAFQ